MQGLTEVENPSFGGKLLIQSAHFINIAPSIILVVFLNGRVWWNYILSPWWCEYGDQYQERDCLSKWHWDLSSCLSNSTCVGSNSLSISEFLIFKPLLLYIDFTVPIELLRWFRVLFLIHSMVANFRLWVIIAKKCILLTNRISTLMAVFFLALIISFGSVI